MSGIPSVPPCDPGMYVFLTQLKAALDGSRGVRLQPKSPTLPATNGEVTIEVTDNHTLTFYLRGNDGQVRSGTVSLT